MYQNFSHIIFGFLFLCNILSFNTLLARERILEYKSTIDIRVDGTLEIIEEITVLAEGKQIKRGIFRDFPNKARLKIFTLHSLNYLIIKNCVFAN